MVAMSWELREIAHQRQFDHLGRKSRALGIDKFALEFLTEQHWTQFLAHLFQELRPNPRAFAADDLDPLDVGAVLPVFVEMPALAVWRGHLVSDAMQAALDPMLAVSKGRLIVQRSPTVRFIGQFSGDRGGSAGSPSRDAGQLAPVPLFSTRAEAKEFEPSKPA